jgi:hypothetical protein
MDRVELLVNIIIKEKRELYNISLESGIIPNRDIILLKENTKN